MGRASHVPCHLILEGYLLSLKQPGPVNTTSGGWRCVRKTVQTGAPSDRSSSVGWRRGGVRRVWLFQAHGRQRSMGGFPPQRRRPVAGDPGFSPQPGGMGPIFPISSLLVASVTGYSALLAPRTRENWLPSPPSEVVLTGPNLVCAEAISRISLSVQRPLIQARIHATRIWK
jgi:hypothetical protein